MGSKIRMMPCYTKHEVARNKAKAAAKELVELLKTDLYADIYVLDSELALKLARRLKRYVNGG